MEKEVAIRIDGMAISIRGTLDGLAHYMKGNLPPEDYTRLIKSVGQSMAALVNLSTQLYDLFPDILPKELCPPSIAERPTAAPAPDPKRRM